MHCSVWRFRGDPDELERRYRAMMEQIPASSHVLHTAARTPDGLLIFDTCPSEEAYHAFFGSDRVRAMLAAHGLRDGGRRGPPGRPGLRPPQRADGRRRERRLAAAHRFHGGTGSVSISYRSIAWATTEGSIVPSSASAFSAATATW
jgi:hypothetical protein